MRVVATGVFDIIHSGHAHFLNAAKENGDELVVIIANDDTVRKMKRIGIKIIRAWIKG